MTPAPHGASPAAWRDVLAEDVPPPGHQGREMSADVFDAEEIARKVFDTEQAAIDEPHELPPLARAQGMTVTGSGDGRGRPVPTQAVGSGEDIFDRLERQRAAHQVRSPFGDHKVARYATDVDQDPDRFVTPDIDDEDLELPMEGKQGKPTTRSSAPRATQASSTTGRAPVAGPSTIEERTPEPAQETRPVVGSGPSHDPRCGQPLTGGGAPRGWVLVRVIGQGQPRRYCEPECAINALTAHAKVTTPRATPERTRRLEQRAATITPRPRPARRAPVPSTLDVPEIVRRYQDGETPPHIGRTLGHTAGTIRKALDRAGIQRRDDRATASGSHKKDYDPQLVARVRALYTLHGLSQAECAEAIGSSTKVVQNIMARHGIEARPDASTPGTSGKDHATGLKQRLVDLGLTSATVRAWARGAGYLVPDVGLVSASLVDAYLAAHQNGAST